MAGMMKPVLIAAMLIAVVMPRGGEAEIDDCRVVMGYMVTCEIYASGLGFKDECCDGIKSLHGNITSTEERQITCDCLKMIMDDLFDEHEEKVAGLPKECSVDAPYMAVTHNIDCSKME